MKKIGNILFVVLVILSFGSCKNTVEKKADSNQDSDLPQEQVKTKNEAHQLVMDMVEAVGTIDKLKSLNDVEYNYIYHDLKSDKKDITKERYIFQNELSWAEYELRELFTLADEGALIQSFNGDSTSVTLDGKMIDNSEVVKRADFIRKTNYYWFVMMYKLLDSGITYEKLEDQLVDNQNYHRVKLSYDEGVGDAQDIYLLYINPETKLVDQFLFTVMDFGLDTPLLMDIKYEEVQGLQLMTHRRYKPANWEGEALTEEWAADVYSKNIKFNNGFKPEDFNL